MDKIGYWYKCFCQLVFVQPSWHAGIQKIENKQKYLQCKNCGSPLMFVEGGRAKEYGEYYLEEE